MRQFPLLLEGEACSFDTDGRVLDAAANVIGTWNTAAGNVIRVTKSGGGKVDLAVEWAFNADNQLTLGIGGNTLFVVASTVDGLPRYRLDRNVMVVDPDGDGDFEFRLECLFGLQPDGNLVVSINGKQAVIDGYIEDSKSRFRFQFFDKTLPSFPNSFVFTGEWERRPDPKQILLRFKLDTASEIPGLPLDLPAAVRVDPQRNHLALVYQSTSHGERQLQFLGSLEIRKGWTLVFRIDDVKDGGVRKSRIEVEATFDWARGSGTLQLFVGKTKSAQAQVIEVGGTVSAKLQNGRLDLSFAYRKSTAGDKTTTTIAAAVAFEFKQGKIFLAYKQDGEARQLDVTARLDHGDFSTTVGLQIINDPSGRRIKSFIGVSF